MKTSKYIRTTLSVALAATMLLLASCRDENLIIYDPVKQGVQGAYARMVDQPPATVTVAGFAAQNYVFTAEIVGVGTDPSQVKSFDITVQLDDPNSVNLKPAKALGSITSYTLFTDTQRPRGTGTFTGAQITTLLGLVAGDIVKGNILTFYTSLTLTNGKVYDLNNVDPNLAASSAFNAPFFHQTTIK